MVEVLVPAAGVDTTRYMCWSVTLVMMESSMAPPFSLVKTVSVPVPSAAEWMAQRRWRVNDVAAACGRRCGRGWRRARRQRGGQGWRGGVRTARWPGTEQRWRGQQPGMGRGGAPGRSGDADGDRGRGTAAEDHHGDEDDAPG